MRNSGLEGATYYDLAKFQVAVDCVIFGYSGHELQILLYPRRFRHSYKAWSLMGGFVRKDESMDGAARRVLELTVGLKDIFLDQVKAFSEPDRDPGGRVISMAYFALIRMDKYDLNTVEEHGGRWFSLTGMPELIFDHREMVNASFEKLRLKATYQLIGKELLPELFTLSQLNTLYNEIFQREFDQGNFRKKISAINILEKTTLKETGSSKRGAYYYRFREDVDHSEFDRVVKF